MGKGVEDLNDVDRLTVTFSPPTFAGSSVNVAAVDDDEAVILVLVPPFPCFTSTSCSAQR